MAVYNALSGITGGLQIAGAFTGIPYASALGTLLSGIIEAAQQIVVHKRKCRILVEKCKSIKIALDDNEAKLVGTELQASADELQAILDRVYSRTRKYKQYGKLKSYLKMGEVEEGLDTSSADLDNALSIFGIHSNITIHNMQREILEAASRSSTATDDLLLQILNSQESMREIVMMERQGQHVAGRLMEAGQLRMQELDIRDGPSSMSGYEQHDRYLQQSPKPFHSRTLSSPRTSSEQRGRVSPQPPPRFNTKNSSDSYEQQRRASPHPPAMFDSRTLRSPKSSYEQHWTASSQSSEASDTMTVRSPRGSQEQHGRPYEDMFADRTPTSSPKPMHERDEIRRGLWELHKLTGVPPTVKILDGEVDKIGDLAVTGGTYSDIWEGKWMGRDKVALKALRNIKSSDEKAKRRFEAEIRVWDKLDHPNILTFYGIVTNLGQIHMVSPWQESGNVLEYVKANPQANRIHLLSGAAEGVKYLHECNIVHGNLKCANILVDENREARICDFGMSTVIEQVTETSASATLTAAGSARWLAPELIEGIVTSPTMLADIYSFAMAILELLTGKHPFSDVKRDASVIHRIIVLKRTPQRPDSPEVQRWLTDDLWSLLQQCWAPDADQRPLMRFVAARINNIEDSMGVPSAMDT
ncbi:kinase-like protein [Athelia psychrophila]|uniref:Kinase-like protein n=1 Tax=Athelia psychrophila TaxID=1759441 RepID=A0A166SYM3_9AGAM|nr:kinase-like protein [Fibularhizoctonia sp. CBS 109695]